MSSSTATPDIAMKPMAAEMENGMPRIQSAQDAADPTERHAGEDTQGVHEVLVRQVEQPEDEGNCRRNDQHQTVAGRDEMFPLAAVLDVVTGGRHLHLFADLPLRLRNETAQGRLRHIAGHRDTALAPFAGNCRRTIFEYLDLSQ